MNKRGMFTEIAAGVLILATALGIFYTVDGIKSIIVGDSDSKIVFDYLKCPHLADTLHAKNIVLFGSIQEASARGYNHTPECV